MHAQANDDDPFLDMSLGAGLGAGPDYEGSDDYEVIFFPYAELAAFDGRARVSVEGLEAELPFNEWVSFGAGLSYGGGRDEDDNDALKGLGDIDDSVEGSLSARLQVHSAALSLQYTQDLGSEHEGYTVDLLAEYEIELIEGKAALTLGAGATWASGNYTQAFFGVDAAQADASGLRQSDVDAGFKNVGVQLGGSYVLGQQEVFGHSLTYVLAAELSYQRLIGDAAESAIVQDEGSPDQFSALAVLAVQFGLF